MLYLKRAFTTLAMAVFLFGSMVAVASEQCQVSVGVVPQFEQRKLITNWRPLLSTLEQKTGCSFVFSGSENIAAFEQRFAAGDFDLAYMNPYHAVVANRTQGYQAIFRSGSKDLQGVLVARKGAGFEKLEHLDNAVLAFPSPNALGASLLMRAELVALHGLSFDSKYVKTHPSVYLHVAKGLVAAGGGVQRTLDEQPKQIRDRLEVIYRTAKVPSHPIVIHPRITESLAIRIKNALSELAKSAPGLFESIPMRNPVPTSMADYRVISTLNLESFAAK